ncbi:hypothetical protein B0A48_05829 [Cryoendolithus antarcticus]|uniref:Uncharacterized protein n=1 Tax=Cryoendolithus antarcticus TaxID=1507870 RepID=A0A1V8TC21_9PEZI|nr:hypothetical protein B0A48_05829 [Cryoendolithus antarcticus]
MNGEPHPIGSNGPNMHGPAIPLNCNICPKRPTFSDVSHLLTHVASKQHLSNLFKKNVQAAVNPNAKTELELYNQWYANWNLDELMRDRMSQKEKKGRGGGGGEGVPQQPSARNTPMPLAMPLPRRAPNLRNTLLDPTLDRRIKLEPMSRPSTPSLIPALNNAAFHQGAYGAAYQGWSSTAYGYTPSAYSGTNSYMTDEDEDDGSYGGSQRVRRNVRGRFSDETTSWQGSFFDEEDEVTAELPGNDNSKLKGEIWPGMDWFDSATPDMRRKRNQKKSVDVVTMLEAMSGIIEPAEIIFDAVGTFKRQRVITGEPTSDSPLEGETEPEPDSPQSKKRPKTRKPGQSRQPLAERDVNGSRKLRGRPQAKPQRNSRASSQLPYFDSSDDMDDEITYRQPRPKHTQRRSGLSIHNDNSGPDIVVDHAVAMNYLNSSMLEPFAHQQGGSRSAPQSFARSASDVTGGYRFAPSAAHQMGATQAGFRSSNNHGLPSRDLSAFGALTNHSMYPSSTQSFPASNGVMHTFQQYGTSATQSATSRTNTQDSGMYLQNWESFDDHHDQEMAFDGMDLGLPAQNTDNTAMNPLFFGGTPPPQEDDERTVSAPSEK